MQNPGAECLRHKTTYRSSGGDEEKGDSYRCLDLANDTEDNITSILDECIRVGVKGIINFGMGMTLREGDREYYYAALDRYFPGMKERYIRQYGNAYEVTSPKARGLEEIFQRICKAHGILSSPEECFMFMNELPEKYSQMSLFDP